MGASIIIPYCTHFFKYYLRKKLILDAEHKDDQHDERQDIAHIEANAVAHLDAAAVVRLVLEILPSPAIARRCRTADRRASPAEATVLETRKSSRSRHVRSPGRTAESPLQTLKPRTHGRDSRIIRTMLTAAVFLRLQPGQIHAAGHDVLENSEHGRECRERHEHKEQSCPTAGRTAMWLKMLGRVTKIRFGPLSGDTPNAKQAGKMIRPAVKATKVSSNADAAPPHPRSACSLADIAAEDRPSRRCPGTG